MHTWQNNNTKTVNCSFPKFNFELTNLQILLKLPNLFNHCKLLEAWITLTFLIFKFSFVYPYGKSWICHWKTLYFIDNPSSTHTRKVLPLSPDSSTSNCKISITAMYKVNQPWWLLSVLSATKTLQHFFIVISLLLL